MTPFDEDELEGLVEFLRDCPGRISSAVVPGQETGTALLERLVEALPGLTFEVMEDSATPGEIGRRAEEIGRSGGNVLVLRLDRRPRSGSEEQEAAFWRWLNFQRERLASGAVRTCLFADDSGNDRLALLADDLYEWVTFFRFPALAPRRELRTSESGFQTLERLDAEVPVDLDVLRDQWRRAREVGLPEQELVWEYTRPLFAALIRSSRIDEASRLWRYELRDGDALEALPEERRLELLLDACLLARYVDRDQFVSRARDYVASAEKVLNLRRNQDSREGFAQIAKSLFNIGYIQSDLGEREAAQKSYHEALEIRRRLAAQRPAVFEPDVAMTLNNLGNVQSDLGEREAAQKSFLEALEIYRRLAAQHPAAFEPDVAMTLNNLGTVQRDLGEREAAQKSFLEALEIRRRLAAQHPAAFEPGVAITLNNLGNVQRDLGEREAARECFAEALGIYAPLAERYPQAFAHNFGIVLRGYTSITPESEDDPWWELWKGLARREQDDAAEDVRP